MNPNDLFTGPDENGYRKPTKMGEKVQAWLAVTMSHNVDKLPDLVADYLNNLNAVTELERKLSKTDSVLYDFSQHARYGCELVKIVCPTHSEKIFYADIATATPPQRLAALAMDVEVECGECENGVICEGWESEKKCPDGCGTIWPKHCYDNSYSCPTCKGTGRVTIAQKVREAKCR